MSMQRDKLCSRCDGNINASSKQANLPQDACICSSEDLRQEAPAGTGQRCGAANACYFYKGHVGNHKDYKGDEW